MFKRLLTIFLFAFTLAFSAAVPAVYATMDGLGNDIVPGNIGIGTTLAPNSGVSLSVVTGNVGIGSAAPSSKLDVNGDVRVGLGTFNNPSSNADLFVTGNLEVDGSVWLGDAAADSLTILGSLNQTGDFTVSGNLGVGTTTPQTKLAILGPVGIGTWTTPSAGTGLVVMNGNVGVGTTTPQGAFTVTNGNVGIGTWAPSSQLQVYGSVSLPTDGASINFANTGSNGSINSSGGLFSLTSSAGTAGNDNFVLNAATGRNIGMRADTTRFTNAGNTVEFARINATGLGIGSTAPSGTLDVNGDVRIGLGTFNNPSTNTDLFVSGNLEVDGSVWLGDAAADSLTILGSLNQTGDFTVSGNLGVGTTTPQTKLAILGPVGIGTWTTPSAGTGLTVMNGNVGIGTWVPATLLHMRGSANVDATMRIEVSSGSNKSILGLSNGGANIDYGKLYFDNSNNNVILQQNYSSGFLGLAANGRTSDLVVANSGNVGIGTTAPQTGLVSMGNVGIGTWTAAGGNLIVKGGGNVGIGSSWPGTALDVTGNIRSSGATQSGTLILTPTSAVQSITAAGGLASVGNSYIKIVGSGGPVIINNGVTQVAAGTDGQELVLYGTSNVNTVQFHDGDGLKLDSGVSFTMGLDSCLRLIYNSTGAYWRELTRVAS